MAIKKLGPTSLKLKELIKAIEEAGGNLEEQMYAQKIFKNYIIKTEEDV